MAWALEIHNLAVNAGAEPVVRGVSLQLREAECLTVLGESGSGKSIMAQAVMGTLPPGLRMTGEISVWGRRSPQPRWGHQVAMLPQEPWLALSPAMRLQPQVAEVAHFVRGQTWPAAQAEASQAMQQLQLNPARRKYPHQISGGMAQRVAFAATCAAGAQLLIADEPTKGLDATLRGQIGQLLLSHLQPGQALLTITHDVALARQLGGNVAVMLDGQVVEQGPASQVLQRPRHAYTQALVQADAAHWPRLARPLRSGAAPVVQAQGLAKSFGQEPVFADVDLALAEGEIVAITGPSGCGKTTLGHMLLGLVPPDRGTVRRTRQRPHSFQKLYQDPPAAFAPQRSVGDSLGDLIKLHQLSSAESQSLMQELKLDANLLARLPSEVSGGELQRFALLRILLLKPDFLFADEPTSRLDPITQQRTMQLLCASTAAHQWAMLLVTHDAALAEKAAHRRAEVAFG
ncbi:peptide/nickel transport system ATP-binding protein [Rhodoferax sp. OV413]|uniref:ABC transporter ATP-binding protein n=1 Tax=Rhodoferax sp. OV413 TaxID=1855285 RepID=UPI000887F4DF|nr:ATP-binding cassette domain-containing protein [Rhodoferax sp. OV413]SDP78123.1 peptide/nickel transport system ATP-binding protein [Rhodoferax sp. OV413]